jgi:hypothetical protein
MERGGFLLADSVGKEIFKGVVFFPFDLLGYLGEIL